MDDKTILDNKWAREAREAVLELVAETIKATGRHRQRLDLVEALEAFCLGWRRASDEVREPPPPRPKPMTDAEARRFGRAPVPYGKFRGRPADEVPMGRLDWYADQRWTDDLRRYLASRRIRDEKRADEDEGGWDG